MIDMQDMKPTNGVKIIKATKPAKAKTTAAANDQEKEILRVAAYCRVSTDSDEQENSYEAQCSYYRRYINSNPKWELAGIFADEGITGTMVRNRKQFQAMIRACEDGKIDMIITKSLSRFSRNTVDCLLTVRRLKELGIPVIFEKEGFNTEVTSGEMMLTFMSSFAQQESESISENTRMGIMYNIQRGVVSLNLTNFLGYDLGDGPHTMVINPQQAAIVRRIYREYLDGFTFTAIARRLQADGIPTASGKMKWRHSTIKSILQNEKYHGDALLQKYYTTDCLTHRQVKNDHKLPQYYVSNHHDPIVPKAVFYQVQGEIRRRGNGHPAGAGYSSDLGGKIFCGQCGQPMKRFKQSKPGNTYWRCGQRTGSANGDSCTCRIAKEIDIKRSIVEAFNELPRRYEQLTRMQEKLANGDIARIDALLEAEESHLKKLTERREQFSNGVEETAFLDRQIEDIQVHKDELYQQRAEYACQDVRIRSVLELIKQMLCQGNLGWRTLITKDPLPLGDACSDYEEFFVRTKYDIADGPFDDKGLLIAFDSELCSRHVGRVVVLDDGYDIWFKAGIHVVV